MMTMTTLTANRSNPQPATTTTTPHKPSSTPTPSTPSKSGVHSTYSASFPNLSTLRKMSTKILPQQTPNTVVAPHANDNDHSLIQPITMLSPMASAPSSTPQTLPFGEKDADSRSAALERTAANERLHQQWPMATVMAPTSSHDTPDSTINEDLRYLQDFINLNRCDDDDDPPQSTIEEATRYLQDFVNQCDDDDDIPPQPHDAPPLPLSLKDTFDLQLQVLQQLNTTATDLTNKLDRYLSTTYRNPTNASLTPATTWRSPPFWSQPQPSSRNLAVSESSRKSSRIRNPSQPNLLIVVTIANRHRYQSEQRIGCDHPNGCCTHCSPSTSTS